ncbi:MAG: nicotinate phosphoribosyltransferase, partial [Eggerthellaceae bacterium]|nr:nicotinate phosphoribosyltransferase [Eggerthellaceae bacterium]
ARARLDEAGLNDCGIVLSNDLDEYSIQAIRDEGADVMSWGVGTKLATAFDQPTLGGVYKLAATRMPDEEDWQERVKITEQANKLTLPGVLNVRRYYHDNGLIAGDMVYDINHDINEKEKIIDPADSMRQKVLAGKRYDLLLHPLARDGKTCLEPTYRNAMAAQQRAKDELEKLDKSQKRILNPHSYPVGLESGMFKRRRTMVMQLRGLDA